jgi:hypothetical protein
MSENLGELANSPAPAAHRHRHSTQCAAFSLATAERRNAFHENCVCSYKSAKDAHYAHSPSAMQSASARKKSAKTKLSDDRMLAARLVLGQPVLLVNSSGSQLFGGRDGNLRSMRLDSESQIVCFVVHFLFCTFNTCPMPHFVISFSDHVTWTLSTCISERRRFSRL